MAKDLIQDLHTKACWGHNKTQDYKHLLKRHIYLDTLLAITKLKSNLKKIKQKNPR